MKRTLTFLMLILSCYLAIGQVKVTGKVTSSPDNDALPGANVVVKGTTTGTITDIDGNYTLEVPSADAILVFYSGLRNRRTTIECVNWL
jgi:hypothetical protein